MSTKEELQTQVDALQAELGELRSQLAARDAALSASGEDGWLLTTKNPAYNGVTAGVEFRSGRGFISDSTPDAERLATQLCNDFGYRRQRLTAKEYRELVQNTRPTPAVTEPYYEKLVRPDMIGQKP